MTPAFAATLSTVPSAGAATRHDTPRRTRDEPGASGGFDRMLQARDARAEGAADAPAAARRQDGRPAARTGETAAPKDTRTATPRDEAVAQEPGDTDTSAAGEDTATAGDDAPRDTAAPSPLLPEQLLAMLNGLAAAQPAAASAPPPAGLADATTAAAKPALPSLPQPSPPPGATAPAPTPEPPTADPALFALAMAATTSESTEVPLDSGAADPVDPTPLTATPTAAMPTLTRTAAPAVPAQPPVPLDAGFDDGFGSRIAWLAEQRVGHAEIRVSPEHLGTIDVRLQLDGNKVHAEFNSAQADVRHALESSLPRLREMLGQQGLQLGHAGVGQQSSGQTPAGDGAMAGDERAEPGTEPATRPATPVRVARGLLDEYA